MNPLMARYAERHQIAFVMCTTLRNRLDVMHKCRKDVSALLLAGLTKRMPRQVTITDFLPRTSVSLMLIVATSEAVIMPLRDFLVRLAVTAFSVREVRTACHTAGAFRLSWHCTSPSKKPSRRITSPRRLIPYPILAECIISHRSY